MAYAKDENSIVSIGSNYFVVGQSIDTLVDSSVDLLKWYVDKEEVYEGMSYTPTKNDYEKWIVVKAFKDDVCIGEDKVYFSKLPVLYIDTEDRSAITSKKQYKNAKMSIQSNNSEDITSYSGDIFIKGRGNGSWAYPKKPYKIKLSKSTNLFDMGKNKHWVLLANYRDMSLMRNTIAGKLSEEIGLVNMDTVWVDVILNGEYVGDYQLCEQIRIAPDRVNIFNWDEEAEKIAKAVYKVEKKYGMTEVQREDIEDQLTLDYSWVTTHNFLYNDKEYFIDDYYNVNTNLNGGYLFQLDGHYDEVTCWKTNRSQKIEMISPEYLKTNDAMVQFAKNYWQQYEDAYCAEDGYNAEGKHYTNYSNLDSMVGFWLTNEIVGNYDALWNSRFCYKDIDSLLCWGPVWDFDYGCGAIEPGFGAMGWQISLYSYACNLYKEWADDPYFCVKAAEKYWEIRDYLNSIVTVDGIIDMNYEYLYESGLADEKRWDRSIKWTTEYRTFTEDVNFYKNYLKERFDWLDQQFATQESIVSSLYTPYSSYPYTKSDKLTFKFVNVVADTVSAEIPADGIIPAGNDVVTSIGVDDESTKTINVYVNGLKYKSYDVVGGVAEFSVDNDALTEESGTRNVISIIGKDSEDNTTYKSFATIMESEELSDRSIATWSYYTDTDSITETDPNGGVSKVNYDFPYGSKSDGYAFTSGELSGDAKLFASLDGTSKRKLEWSEDLYATSNNHMPVMTAGNKNPWSAEEHPYFEVVCSTKGYENLIFSASLGAAKKGPADWKLQYSLDGENFSDVLNDGEPVSFSILKNKTIQKAFVNVPLPEALNGKKQVYIRIVAASNATVGGGVLSDNPTGGETAINDIVLYGKEAAEYTVTYHLNNLAAEVVTDTFNMNTIPEAIDISSHTDVGYSFAGWYADEAYQIPFTFEDELSLDTDIYAKWEMTRISNEPLEEMVVENSVTKVDASLVAAYEKWEIVDNYGSGTANIGEMIRGGVKIALRYIGEDKDMYAYDTVIVSVYRKACEWEDEYTEDVSPTCTQSGRKSIHCKKCDEKKDDVVVDATGHLWNEWEIIVNKSCEKTGLQIHSCSVCGLTEVSELGADTHGWEADYTIDVSSTCLEAGSKSIHCTKCDERKNVTEIPATGHDWNEWETIVDAVCEKAGIRMRTCKVCNVAETQMLNPLVHEWESEYKVDKEPTCITEGSKSYHCKNCVAVKDSVTIQTKGHDFTEWDIVSGAAVNKKGLKIRNCAVCGKSEIKTIPAVKLSTSSKNFVFNGKPQIPSVSLADIEGKSLVEGQDYKVVFSDATSQNAGSYKVTVSGAGEYDFEEVITYQIQKAEQTIQTKCTNKKVKRSVLKKKQCKFSLGAKASGKGKISYKVTKYPNGGRKSIKVSKSGKVALRKNAKRGKYEITVTAKENGNYKKAEKRVSVIVK